MANADYFGGETNALGFGFASDPHGYGWPHLFFAFPHLLITTVWVGVACVLLFKLQIRLSIAHLLLSTSLFAIAIVAFERFNPMPFIVLSSTATILLGMIFMCFGVFTIFRNKLLKKRGITIR